MPLVRLGARSAQAAGFRDYPVDPMRALAETDRCRGEGKLATSLVAMLLQIDPVLVARRLAKLRTLFDGFTAGIAFQRCWLH